MHRSDSRKLRAADDTAGVALMWLAFVVIVAAVLLLTALSLPLPGE